MLQKKESAIALNNSIAIGNLLAYLNQQGQLSAEFNITIEPMLSVKRPRTNLQIASPGSICRTAYWMEKGYARFFMKYKDPQGFELEDTIGFSKHGKIMVLPECFFKAEPCPYFVEIAAGSVTIPFSRSNFDALKLSAPEAEALANNILSMEITDHIVKMKMLKLKPRERYAEFLNRFGIEIGQFFKVKQIANYLNMQPSYLSRIRGEVKRK